jgi:hypothetical protein
MTIEDTKQPDGAATENAQAESERSEPRAGVPEGTELTDEELSELSGGFCANGTHFPKVKIEI